MHGAVGCRPRTTAYVISGNNPAVIFYGFNATCMVTRLTGGELKG